MLREMYVVFIHDHFALDKKYCDETCPEYFYSQWRLRCLLCTLDRYCCLRHKTY